MHSFVEIASLAEFRSSIILTKIVCIPSIISSDAEFKTRFNLFSPGGHDRLGDSNSRLFELVCSINVVKTHSIHAKCNVHKSKSTIRKL